MVRLLSPLARFCPADQRTMISYKHTHRHTGTLSPLWPTLFSNIQGLAQHNLVHAIACCASPFKSSFGRATSSDCQPQLTCSRRGKFVSKLAAAFFQKLANIVRQLSSMRVPEETEEKGREEKKRKESARSARPSPAVSMRQIVSEATGCGRGYDH